VALTIERFRGDVVFLDPPYDLEREYAAVLELLGKEPSGLVVAQHSVRLELADSYGALRRTRVLKQGDNSLSFFTSAPH
jgi:16S rRNA G966 N2-methylase RsmD